MPTNYVLVRESRLVITIYSGKVTLREVLDLVDIVETHTIRGEVGSIFADVSRVTEIDITKDQMADMAGLIKGLSSIQRWPHRKAVYAPSELAYLSACAFRDVVAAGQNVEIGVFRELPAALAFARVDETAVGIVTRLVSAGHH